MKFWDTQISVLSQPLAITCHWYLQYYKQTNDSHFMGIFLGKHNTTTNLFYMGIFQFSKVHIFWKGFKILLNLHGRTNLRWWFLKLFVAFSQNLNINVQYMYRTRAIFWSPPPSACTRSYWMAPRFYSQTWL